MDSATTNPPQAGNMTWTRKQRQINHLLRAAYTCSHVDIFNIMHEMNPEWRSRKEGNRSVIKIREDYDHRNAAGRAQVWRDIVKDAYSSEEVEAFQAIQEEIEIVAAKLGIQLEEASPAPPCLTGVATATSSQPPQRSTPASSRGRISFGGKRLSDTLTAQANVKSQPTYASEPPTGSKPPKTPRSRVCQRCRSRKKRCSGGRPCSRCQANGIDYAGCTSDGEESTAPKASKKKGRADRVLGAASPRATLSPSTSPAVLERIPSASRTGRMLESPSNFLDGDSPTAAALDDANGGEVAAEQGEADDGVTRRVTRSRSVAASMALENDEDMEEAPEEEELPSPKQRADSDAMPQNAPQVNLSNVSTVPGKLPMVHHSHLAWKEDRILFTPRNPFEVRGLTIDGYIDPNDTHKAIYDYGGPVYRIVRCSPPSRDTGSQQQLHKEDVMVCMKDYCTMCATAAYKPPVPAANLSRYRSMGFVHLHRDCQLGEDGVWRFQQREGEPFNTMLSGKTTAQVEFLDGQAYQCCVCLESCSFCDPDEYAIDNSEVAAALERARRGRVEGAS